MEREWLHTVRIGDTLDLPHRLVSRHPNRRGQHDVIGFDPAMTNQHGKMILRCAVPQRLAQR
jgi:hypothetical protein